MEFLGNHHVAFGGASGFFSETLDGTTWYDQQLNSGSGTVTNIVGETWRVMVSIAGYFFERSVVTLDPDAEVPEEMVWREFKLQGDASLDGNITDMAMLTWMNGPNVLAAVTDAAEIVYARPGVMQYV